MNKVFNTSLETSLRVSLLLATSGETMSRDEICATDFVATYAGEFTDMETSVNGNNRFMYSEYTARRELTDTALRELILRGIVEPELAPKGFTYKLTKEGTDFVASLRSTYANEYQSSVPFACKYIQEVGLDKVINDIMNKAPKGIR